MYKRWTVAAFMTMAIMACFAGSAPGEIDPAGLTWQLDGRTITNASGAQPIRSDGMMELAFGPQADPVLLANEFQLVDVDNDVLEGTWQLDQRGRLTLDIPEFAVEDYVADKLSMLIGAGETVGDVTVQRTNARVNLRSTRSGLMAIANIMARGQADIDNMVGSRTVRFNIRNNGRGDLDVAPGDFIWTVPTTIRGSIRGAGSITDESELTVVFGPNVQEGLASNEFIAFNNAEGRTFTGTYDDTNGRLELDLDEEPVRAYLEDYVTEQLEQEFAQVSDIVLTLNRIRTNARLSPGDSLFLQFQFQFQVAGVIDGEAQQSRGVYLERGTGTPELIVAPDEQQPENTFFVDPVDGEDDNDGTADEPFMTITRAVSVADPNGIINLESGIYSQDTGETFPIVLKPGQRLLGQGDATVICGFDEVDSLIGPDNEPLRATVVANEGTVIREVTFGGCDEIVSELLHFGVFCGDASCTITENTFADDPNSGGVYLTGDGEGTVSENVFFTSAYGVFLDDTTGEPAILSNAFLGSGIPIWVAGAQTMALVRDNIFEGQNGVYVDAGQPLFVENVFNLEAGSNSAAFFAATEDAKPTLRENVFRSFPAIVIVAGDPNLGTANDPGENDFSDVPGPAIQFTGNGTIFAIGNIWRQFPPVTGNALGQDVDIVITDDGMVIWGDIPETPELTATTLSDSSVRLDWMDVDDETGFRLERSTSATGPFTQIALIDPDEETFEDTGLDPGTTYFYRLSALGGGGMSEFSPIVFATTSLVGPNAPDNLQAQTVSGNRIDLTWDDNADNETGFAIEARTSDETTWTQLGTTDANDTSFSATGLDADTVYFFRVRAFNAAGFSAFTDEVSASTLDDDENEAPAAPSDLEATAVSSRRIDLTWQDNSNNEDGFVIESRVGITGVFVPLATLGQNETSFSDTGLMPDTAYFYRVRAFNDAGDSDRSDAVFAVTPAQGVTPPDAPDGLDAVAVDSGRIDLTWNDNSNDEQGFLVQRRIGATGVWLPLQLLGPNQNSFSDTGLTADTTYFYRVRAFNAAGDSDFSDVDFATTPTNGQPTIPNAPTNLDAVAVASDQIDLTWTDNADDEQGFLIERRIGATGDWLPLQQLGTNENSFSDTGLTADTTYFYRVRAFNAAGDSDFSNVDFATTPTNGQPTIPNAPTDLNAFAVSSNTIDLTWTDNADDEDGFFVQRRIGLTGDWQTIASLAANDVDYTDSPLAPETLYFYRVRAFNSAGDSIFSNEANATTLQQGLNPPAAPDNVQATAMSDSIVTVAWQDNADNEEGFQVERRTATGDWELVETWGPWDPANPTGPSAFSPLWFDEGRDPDTEYFYRVRSFNAGGFSDWSAESSTTTFPTT